MLKAYLLKIAAGLGVLSGAGLGQSMTPLKHPLSFEVASIKEVAPLDAEALMSGKRPDTSIDNAFVHFTNRSVMDLVWWAYHVSRNRVVGGPAWLSKPHAPMFDIVAKMPDGATKEQVPEMLQTLLAERFKLVVHREKREASAYALIVGRGGARLKEPAPNLNVPEGQQPRTVPGKDGRIRYEFDSVSMERFASLLSRYVDRPVVDQTGLKGSYQGAFEVDLIALASRGLMSVMPNADPSATDPISDPGDSIVSSLKQLGLKLDSRVLPVPVLVIDHIERKPTEN
jgi:uncharacterized protein (TIGR03435 family)